jgi:hypothetical protein
MTPAINANPFGPEQTVELQSVFEKCGVPGVEWIDIPKWITFTAAVPLAGGGLLAGQKQSVGSADGADFYLRRISVVNFEDPVNGPQVFGSIKFPNGRYLQSGSPSTILSNIAGKVTPGPLGLIKPEVRCPAGSQFTIDLLNVSATFAPPGSIITVNVVFVGVYRFRLRKAC